MVSCFSFHSADRWLSARYSALFILSDWHISAVWLILLHCLFYGFVILFGKEKDLCKQIKSHWFQSSCSAYGIMALKLNNMSRHNWKPKAGQGLLPNTLFKPNNNNKKLKDTEKGEILFFSLWGIHRFGEVGFQWDSTKAWEKQTRRSGELPMVSKRRKENLTKIRKERENKHQQTKTMQACCIIFKVIL